MTRPLLYGFLRKQVIIPYLKYLIVDIYRPGIRSRILAGLERIRVLPRKWDDVEALELDFRTNGEGVVYEKYFTEASNNLEAMKADLQNSFINVQHHDSMLTYILMDSPPSVHRIACKLALGEEEPLLYPIKPWEELKKQWSESGKSIAYFKTNDRLSELDDVNVLIASIIHPDIYKKAGKNFDSPAQLVEAFQTHLMHAIVFTPGMFAAPKQQQMQMLMLRALGDLPPLKKQSDAHSQIRTSIYLSQVEKTDPVLHYLVETLCTTKFYRNPISIDLFTKLYHRGVLDKLIRGCTYPVSNVPTVIRRVNITPDSFRHTFRYHIEECQHEGPVLENEVYRTRQIYKQMR